MSKFAFILMMILCISQISRAGAKSDSASVTHVFHDGDTLWFVAQMYYGNGAQFQKIMDANHLHSADELRDGMKLKIPQPTYQPSQKGFEARVNLLRDQRASALSQQIVTGGEGDKVIRVVLPQDQLLKDDANNPRAGGLPEIPVKDQRVTPQEKSKDQVGGR